MDIVDYSESVDVLSDDRDEQTIDEVSAGTMTSEPSPFAKAESSSAELPTNYIAYETVNGIPCYKPEHVLDGRIQIFERIGFDDRIGATFLGIGPDDKELVLRVGPSEPTVHVVRMEAAFLCKAEAENKWRFFSQVRDIWQTDDAYHMTLFFRGGPRLDECLRFRDGHFSLGTAGRFALDILQIIRCAHSLGYIVRNVNLENFHFDAASRHLFMADISCLVKDPTATGQIDARPKEGVAPYVGSLDFAPVIHQNNERISKRQDLESWLYVFVYMLKGLPWDSLPFAEVGKKKTSSVNAELFDDLPDQFGGISAVLFKETPFTPVSEEEYDELERLTAELVRNVARIADHDENFDFEREPTAEETPRLMLVRDDEDTK